LGIAISNFLNNNNNLMTNILQATQNAATAFDAYSKISAAKRAEFLDAIAINIEALGEELLQVANQETNLPLPRLTGERGRTCFQLRMFANMLRKGDYVDATIDTAIPDKTPPKPDIRQMLHPLGPVVVFGASNFPFAYSTAGGDTASALAAGCSVIVKAHPAHLQTSTLVAEAIQQAIKSNAIPENTFQHITATDFTTGKALVQDENITAVGFTGSRTGGRALYDYANARKNPIPVFAEMGSVNPVVLLEGALAEQAENISKNYAGSITLGMGQFCTNPGILIGVKSEALTLFADLLAKELNQAVIAPMLHEGIQTAYFKNSTHALNQMGITCLTTNTPTAHTATPVLTTVDASVFLANSDLAEEVFGPYSILVQCDNIAQLILVWKSIKGQISTTMMGTDLDFEKNKNLLQIATDIAGRVLLNGVPTGVEVCDSMVHGGPYPASTDSRFTAVGVKAVKRWLRPISYQNWPDHLLPQYLQNKNELEVWRTINGTFTKSDVAV
jgi:alpha-ketoglutaric semialdehyde dehydrogenase